MYRDEFCKRARKAVAFGSEGIRLSIMNDDDYLVALHKLVQSDSRYGIEAYSFVERALQFALSELDKPKSGPERHLSGEELLEEIRKFALREYGPMALRVLNSWGLYECLDFGRVVFTLVDFGLMGKSDDDTLDDFSEGYDFREAFQLPFLPREEQVKILEQ